MCMRACVQRRSQDFCLGGATRYIFRHLSGEPTAFSGGGGSSRSFPCTRLPDQIEWGGG